MYNVETVGETGEVTVGTRRENKREATCKRKGRDGG